MPPSLAIIANGTTFLRGDGGSPEVFTAVPEVSKIEPGAPSSNDIDISHLTSTAQELRSGIQRFGAMSVTWNLVQGNAIQNAIEDEAGLTQTPRNYRISHPDNINGRTYSLICKTCAPTGFVVDGKIEMVATFAVSGRPIRFP